MPDKDERPDAYEHDWKQDVVNIALLRMLADYRFEGCEYLRDRDLVFDNRKALEAIYGHDALEVAENLAKEQFNG